MDKPPAAGVAAAGKGTSSTSMPPTLAGVLAHSFEELRADVERIMLEADTTEETATTHPKVDAADNGSLPAVALSHGRTQEIDAGYADPPLSTPVTRIPSAVLDVPEPMPGSGPQDTVQLARAYATVGGPEAARQLPRQEAEAASDKQVEQQRVPVAMGVCQRLSSDDSMPDTSKPLHTHFHVAAAPAQAAPTSHAAGAGRGQSFLTYDELLQRALSGNVRAANHSERIVQSSFSQDAGSGAAVQQHPVPGRSHSGGAGGAATSMQHLAVRPTGKFPSTRPSGACAVSEDYETVAPCGRSTTVMPTSIGGKRSGQALQEVARTTVRKIHT